MHNFRSKYFYNSNCIFIGWVYYYYSYVTQTKNSRILEYNSSYILQNIGNNLACVAGSIRGHKGEAWNTACPKTKHFELSGSWVMEHSDWLEYRFEFMIDRKNTSSFYLRNWNQLVLTVEVAS